MHWTQIIFPFCIVASLWIGGARAMVWVAVLGNFFATVTLSQEYLPVGVADAISATILLAIGGRREAVIAAIYGAMIPLYVAGLWLHWQLPATYAIVDALGILQLLVIARVDRGLSRPVGGLCRFTRGRGAYTHNRGAAGGNMGRTMAMDTQESGALNG